MDTQNIKDTANEYQKPEIDVIEIEAEGQILAASSIPFGDPSPWS